MAKKGYDVTERFKEVARRAKQQDDDIKKSRNGQLKLRSEKPEPSRGTPGLPNQAEIDYATRPGRIKGPNSGKDVNLPYEGKKKKQTQGPGSRLLRD